MSIDQLPTSYHNWLTTPPGDREVEISGDAQVSASFDLAFDVRDDNGDRQQMTEERLTEILREANNEVLYKYGVTLELNGVRLS